MLKLLLILLGCLTILTGCSTVHLHPVDEQDIQIREDGWVCMSQDYVKHVMKVTIEEA